MIEITNEDNMDLMARYPDKYFDLAIVDPPYGTFDETKKIERTGGTWSKKYTKKVKQWDFAPQPEYFKELFRISKNQIIWGGNYFNLPPCRCFLIWEKLSISESFSMAMCEYAWTSFNSNAKLFKYMPQDSNRIHHTQKPVDLYRWILSNYAKPNDKILDTHLGSGSIAIACHDLGFNLTACELDTDYYNATINRLRLHQQQQKLNLNI